CSAEVVSADGRLVVASPHADPELFWGLCGGGGNLGVVTELELALHPIAPQVLAGMLLYPGERAAAIIEGFCAIMTDAPDELGAMLALLSAPVADWVPEHLRGRPSVALFGGWLGAPERGIAAIEQLRGLAPVAVDTVRAMPYLELQQLLEPGPAGALRHHWTADCLSELPAAAIAAVVSHAHAAPSPLSQTLLMPGGGALQRSGHDTLLGARHAPWSIHVVAMWTDPADDERHRAWVDTLRTQLARWITARNYLNFADDDPQALQVALGTAPHARLAALKRRYDPTNLFRHNPNVTPAGTATP
ncbi:MAG: BBE domain-containing protein, partial [Solirubrobacteraceae bacterium]